MFLVRASIFGPIIACLTCISFFVSAQTIEINSLKKSIQNSISDIEKADLYYKLAEKLYSTDFEDGYANAGLSLKLSKEIDYKRGIAQALTSIGTYHHYKGNNTEALKYYQDAVKSIAGKRIDDFPFNTLMRLSILYRHQGYFDSSRYYLDKAKIEIQHQVTSPLHGSWNASMGLLLNAFYKNEEALKYVKASLSIRQRFGDSVRIADTWRQLGLVHSDLAQYDSAEYCYDKALLWIGKIDDPEVRMTLFLNRGETSFAKGEFVKASENYRLALDKLKGNTIKRYYSILLFKIGELYENQGVYHTAYDYLFNAMKEFESSNARQDQAKALTQIGWCYAFQENFPLAIENANKSLAMAKLLMDSASIGQNQNLIGYIYSRQKKYKEALSSFDEALRIRAKLKFWWGVSFTMYNKAVVYIDLGQHDKAYELLFQSLKLDERIEKLNGIAFTCNELGLLFAKDKKFDKASIFLARANSLAKKIPIPTQLLANYKNYIFLYQSEKNSLKTIEYYALYTELKDSLNQEINTSRIAKADALFQLQKKANEIELVNKENEVNQERVKTQQVELNFQRRIIIGVGIGTVFLSILVTIIYRLFVSNKKAKNILRKQNSEITESREKILAQSEELTKSNKKLFMLNDELTEKNQEIETQSEKIKEANTTLEKRVDERTSQLNTAYSELETFFYKTSHDFRRPLTTYLGLVALAKASIQDSQALDLFDKVRETTISLDTMLIKLQSISNIDYGRVSTKFSMTKGVEDSLRAYTQLIKVKRIEVIATIEVDFVKTNEPLLKIILENIIENAVNFCTPLDPYLRINVTQTNATLVIIIEDNGQGIPAAIQHRIFEMYFRGNDNSKGNGLGLYIAKRAVDKLGGTISFISRLNEGTSFKISIPLDA